MPGSIRMPAFSLHRLDRRRFAGNALAGLTLGLLTPSRLAAARQGHGIPASPGPGTFQKMLGMVPAAFFDLESTDGLIWVYADIAGQLEALGILIPVPGQPLPEGYVNATFPLVIWSNMFNYALDDVFVEAIGFSPFVIEQVITAGLPPAVVSVHSGQFDAESMISAWESVGYERTGAGSGGDYWSLGDGTFDIEHPVQRRVISSMNNLALVDGLLITAGTKDAMDLVLASSDGTEPSLAAHAGTMQGVEAFPANTVSAAGFNPRLLFAGVDTSTSAFAESNDEVGPMPPIETIVSGVTSGLRVIPNDASTPVPTPDHAAGEGIARIHLVTGSDHDAGQAATVAEHRWTTSASERTQAPLNDLMPLESATSEGTSARLTFTLAGPQRTWFDVFLQGNTFPFTPSGSQR